ncbi:hypothetical protein, partial [Staphylococcus epidermidis]|uniref:hypothetical protein n=1 Tax=Staphylococcus epidermidis TaxID=1282 RepID=UPI0011AA7564
MNQLNQLTIIFTQIKHNSQPKLLQHNPPFSNINPLLSNHQIKSFPSIIQPITPQHYHKLHILKTQSL